MNIDLEENVRKGRELIQKGKSLGKDTRALEERVRALEAQLRKHLKGNPDNFPNWYTEEDRKAMAVQEGICKTCAHLWFVKDNNPKHEFKGLWCAALKVKLEEKVETCPQFYAFGDEVDRLAKQMGVK
jgi:hypothetical protein